MHIYIYDRRSKGPCRDCALQKPQGSNMRRRENLSEFARVIFLAKDLETYFNMRPRRKENNRGVREVFAKVNF